MFTLDTEFDALASLLNSCRCHAYLLRVEFFKVGKIAQLNTVSHGQCMSSLPIKALHDQSRTSSTGLAASSLSVTELALVVSRTEAAVTDRLEGASPLACP